MNFCLDLSIYMDNSEKFPFTSLFLVINAKKNNTVFEDKWLWSKICYQIKILANTSNKKAMNRNCSNQKANPALKTKTGNK